MKFGWIEVLLIMLAKAVLTLVSVWAWQEFKSWRINREYSPGQPPGPGPGSPAR